MPEKRADYVDLNARLAVLEARTKRHREDTKEILHEVKVISAFINEMRPRVDCIEHASPEVRLTKLEANQRHVGIIVGILFSIAAFKDYIWEILKYLF